MATICPVTVVINSYNGGAYIGAAIGSVLAQSFEDFELLVVDDASTDDTVERVRAFEDDRIRIVELEKNVPVALARTEAIRAATGTWIAFLDQDDLWMPDKLTRQVALTSDPADFAMIYGRALRFGEGLKPEPYDTWYGWAKLPEGAIFPDVLSKPSFVPMSTIVVRRDIAERMLPMPCYVRHCPDYYIALSGARAGKVAVVQDVCCRYRVHSASMSQTLEAEIHAEAAEIIAGAARSEHGSILRQRRKVSASMIARTEIRRGDVRQGLKRLFRDGSVGFLVFRKLLHVYRRVKNSTQGIRMRYQVLQTIRNFGFLNTWDKLSLRLKSARATQRNRAFLKANPGFRAPPTDLAFDAYNSIDLEHYHTLGKQQAEGFAHHIRAHLAKLSGDEKPRVLEWGCGPARLIKHMPELLPGAEIFGTDYNDRSIAWCQENIEGVAFKQNQLNPPLDFPDNHFDACYNFSVLTHLSEEVQLAWAAELHRVLKPGGMLVATTHGKNFEHLIVSEQDRADHASGKLVVQGGYEEGKKWFFAIHPDAFVTQKLLAAFDDVRRVNGAPWSITQDVWLAQKSG